MATRPPLSPPANQTEYSVSRITREGKKLTYKLNVMQQPERARACGAGAKSSADRRPVDPPPVVELRIFESDPNDDMHRTDITFAYNANFFLFATLETARPIAQGRLAPTPTFPVLTGVPVAGVAYLDRPSQAGYFIFPDLSVRHEGVYRLSFHLYEETKDSKDASEGARIQSPMMTADPLKPSAPKSFLEFRLEVVSVPFTVFSAKKFPGLTCSTSLSRIIAEQGCRVRIRRDVRMRRRGDKRAEEYDYDEDKSYHGRIPDRYSTPDTYVPNPLERPRSTSIGTIEHGFPYGAEPPRRPSVTEYGFPTTQVYQRAIPPAAGPPQSTPSPAIAVGHPGHNITYQSHLSFGATQTQYPAAPQIPRTPQSATTPTHVYAPHPSYPHARTLSMSTEYDPAPSVYSYPHARPDHIQAPLPPMRLPPSTPNVQPPVELRPSDPIAYQAATQPVALQTQSPTNAVPSLPSLKSISGEFPNNIPQHTNNATRSPSLELPAGKRPLWETGSTTSSKRSYEKSFGYDERPLHNGMRMDADSISPMSRRASDVVPMAMAVTKTRNEEMAYKRANGTTVTRLLPSLE
ncbi:sexual development activator VeA [Aspergillus heteromorphus CBS 117.55]|uniref:Developmental and secondary metabolism regulator veA n=1 Tax=Aspergillus heteromorphus CBS 117.55 TaxID=1448321 RepID=A0A317VUZ0_9EURO|nr:sexual development activator VeA [Aspergillus heteromorphus CBS 117.55]PWY77429.1 sexual development activator VeA [Aspergillus heteromorphus CBS 117.55]